GGAQRVAELDHLGRLDKHRGAGRRLVVHDAPDARAGGRADGDHVATFPHRHRGVGRAVGGIERGEHGIELLDQTRTRLPHRAASTREGAGGTVLDLAIRVEGDGEPLLELFRGGGDPQGGSTRRLRRQAGQIARDDPGGGERAPKPAGHTAAASSPRTIWFPSLPSARPLNLGITCPMTFPRSFAPPAMASRTARRISSASTAAGRNSSSAVTSASSASARSARPAAVYCSAASRRRLIPRRTTSAASSSDTGCWSSNSRFLRS